MQFRFYVAKTEQPLRCMNSLTEHIAGDYAISAIVILGVKVFPKNYVPPLGKRQRQVKCSVDKRS